MVGSCAHWPGCVYCRTIVLMHPTIYRHHHAQSCPLQPDASKRWTLSQALARSAVFEAAWATADGASEATILLDTVTLHEKPSGSCRDQLLTPQLVEKCVTAFRCRGFATRAFGAPSIAGGALQLPIKSMYALGRVHTQQAVLVDCCVQVSAPPVSFRCRCCCC